MIDKKALITRKTVELNGFELCYAAATAEGMTVTPEYILQNHYRPDRLWARCGPIMDLMRGLHLESDEDEHKATASIPHNGARLSTSAQSLRVAVLRLFVLKKIGDTVEVPQSLLV